METTNPRIVGQLDQAAQELLDAVYAEHKSEQSAGVREMRRIQELSEDEQKLAIASMGDEFGPMIIEALEHQGLSMDRRRATEKYAAIRATVEAFEQNASEVRDA